MNNKEKQFEKMTGLPVGKLILSLSIPTIISMLITTIYNMADTYFVSELGTSASGAIGVVFGLQAVMQAFGFMYGHGAGSFISRSLGSKNSDDATKYASTSFFSSIITGLLITVLGLVFINPLMRLLGSTDTILPYSRSYGFFILLAAPFMTASCVLNNILRYEGQAFFAMIGLTAGGIINIFLDPLLIFGANLGAAGAGIATMSSQMISFFILLSMFFRGKTQSRLKFRYVTRDLKDFANIIAVGFASFARQAMNSVSTMILNNQAAFCGGDSAVAAMSITNRVVFFIFAVALGIGQGFQPVAAFNYGAGKYSRVKKGYFFTMICGTVIIGILSGLAFIFAQNIIAVFRDEFEVIDIGALALRYMCLILMTHPVTVASNMLFQSIGKAGRATFLASLRNGIIFIPVISILPHIMGVQGVMLAQPISDIITAVISLPVGFSFIKTLPEDK